MSQSTQYLGSIVPLALLGRLTLNIVGSVVSAYLILRCTFSYYVDEAGGVGCTGADVCSEQVGASCLQIVCLALDQAACKSNFFLLPPTCTHPCSHCPVCSVDSPSLAIRLVALVSLVVTSWDIVLFEAADRSRVLVQSG